VTVLEVIQRSAAFLARKGVESPRLQVELILAQVLGLPRLRLYLEFERVLTGLELESVRGMVARRGRREPLQQVLGTTSFCGLELRVTPDVLIPRPETELLAEQAWTWLRRRAEPGGRRLEALDFGTGSGCLAIAAAAHCEEADWVALDVSAAALEVARGNAARHGLAGRVRFALGDGFGALGAGAAFDLIAANPPYIPSGEIAGLAPEVRDHDPRLALDGGVDGLDFYRLLAGEAAGWMRPGGRLMLEFGAGQAPAVRALLHQARWRVDRVLPDDTGRERLLLASLPPP
jgi:release factor glutamine methyltransferase